jgi:hypothetical protein
VDEIFLQLRCTVRTWSNQLVFGPPISQDERHIVHRAYNLISIYLSRVFRKNQHEIKAEALLFTGSRTQRKSRKGEGKLKLAKNVEFLRSNPGGANLQIQRYLLSPTCKDWPLERASGKGGKPPAGGIRTQRVVIGGLWSAQDTDVVNSRRGSCGRYRPRCISCPYLRWQKWYSGFCPRFSLIRKAAGAFWPAGR